MGLSGDEASAVDGQETPSIVRLEEMWRRDQATEYMLKGTMDMFVTTET